MLFSEAFVLQIQLSRLKKALVSKNKKPKQASLQGFYVFIHNTVVSDCGAGENRTPVQTSNYKAFYMLSSLFNFRYIPDQKPPNIYLAS